MKPPSKNIIENFRRNVYNTKYSKRVIHVPSILAKLWTVEQGYFYSLTYELLYDIIKLVHVMNIFSL